MVRGLVKPDAIVWKGDPSLPRELQRIRVLGAPISSPECVTDQLQKKSDEQETLFTRIPLVEDTQECWLLANCGHENKLAKFGFFWPNAVWPNVGMTFSAPRCEVHVMVPCVQVCAFFFFS